MRKRTAVFLALVVVLVLGIAAMASGIAATPALTASRTAVVYPHSMSLVSNVSTPSVIQRRLAGSDAWVDFIAVPSGNTTRTIKPTSTAAYKVVSDGVDSDTVTVTVAAQLSKPQVNKHGHKGHKLTIKGWVAPMHRSGDVQLKFFRWEKVGTVLVTKRHGKSKTIAKYEWVQHGDTVNASLFRQNSQRSKWSYKWTPSAKGTWKIVVSHEDVAHVYSSASAKTVIKR